MCVHACVCIFVHICICIYICVYSVHMLIIITFNSVYICTINLFVGIGNDTLGRSRSSLQLTEVNHFLLSVKDRFSEVLLPVESITKQGLLGKGYKDYSYVHDIRNNDFYVYLLISMYIYLFLCIFTYFYVRIFTLVYRYVNCNSTNIQISILLCCM